MHLYIVFIVQCTMHSVHCTLYNVQWSINMVQISDHQYTPSASLPISLYIYIHALRIALRNKPVLRNYAVVLLDIGYAGALCPRDVISRLFITAWQIKQAQPSLRLDVLCTVYSVHSIWRTVYAVSHSYGVPYSYDLYVLVVCRTLCVVCQMVHVVWMCIALPQCTLARGRSVWVT